MSRKIEVGGKTLEFSHTAVNGNMHLFIDMSHDPKLCPECISPGLLVEDTNPTQPDSWLDEAITYNVNRGLIHEDRWNDLKAAILQHEAQAVELAEQKARHTQRGLLNRLNAKIFFSSSNPTGQYVKNCIIEELEKIPDEAALRAGKENTNEQ